MLSFKDFMQDPSQDPTPAQDNGQRKSAPVAQLRVVRPLDEIFSEIEGLCVKATDFHKAAPYELLVNPANHDNDPDKYQEIKDYLIAWAVNKRAKSKCLEKITEYEQKYNVPKKQQPVLTPSQNGFTGVDQMFFNGKTPDYCEYACSDEGIMGKTTLGVPFRVCSHPILITKRYVNKDDPKREREFVDVSYVQDGRWKTLEQVPASTISNAQKMLNFLPEYGVNANQDNYTALSVFLSNFHDANRKKKGKDAIIPEAICTSKVGWRDGFKAFVPYMKDVFYDNSIPGTRSMFAALHEEGSLEEWLNTVKPIMDATNKRNIPSRIMMAGSAGSVLVRLLGTNCFWINLNSDKSGSGKSVVLMAAGSIWGNPLIGEDGFVQSVLGTLNGLEEKANFCNNLPLCLDEIQTMEGNSEWTPMVYRLCQGKGKNRASRNGGSQVDRTWRLIILSTGEMNIVKDDAHEGEINRIVDLYVQDMDFMDDPVSTAASLQVNYGHAGKLLVKGIMENENVEALRSRFRELRGKLIQNKRTSKQADAGAMIVLASELLDRYVFKYGTPLTLDDVQTYLATEDQVNINRRTYERFKQFVAENVEYFVTDVNSRPLKTWGKLMNNGSHVRIIPSVFRDQFLDKHGFNYKAFTQWCIRNGVMEDRKPRLAIDTCLWDNDTSKAIYVPCLDIILDKNLDEPDPTPAPVPEQKQDKLTEQQRMDLNNGFTQVSTDVDGELPF